MSKRTLRILPYRGERSYQYYLDGLKVNGKRKRLFFKTEKEALDELRKRDRQLRKEGEEGAGLSQASRILAAKAEERLAPFQKSLWDAVEFYVDHLERMQGSVPVSAVFADYCEAKERAGLSEKHRADIRLRLGRFVAKFGQRLIKSISVHEIEDWLHGLALSPQTIINHRAILCAFFEYTAKRDLVEKNPVTPIEKVKLFDKAPEIFTPAELTEVLNAAPQNILPALAIQAFAGLRTAELLRLDWAEVDQARGYITVSARKAKTAQRRLVPIAPNLADWLRPFAGKSSGAVWSESEQRYHRAIGQLLGETTLLKWPQNGLRHSFASYHLAEHQNAAELALHLGHSTTKLIFAVYREVVSPEAAHAYWAISPARRPQNVVAMAKASV